MTQSDVQPRPILDALLTRFPGCVLVEAWGESSVFYNPNRRLPRGVYFATVKQKDGANDRASDLDRPGVFRLNIGTAKALFIERFGPPPPRPAKGRAIEGPWDFTATDVVTPHPVYGWMAWIAVLNPSRETLDALDPFLIAAFEKAKAAFEQKLS